MKNTDKEIRIEEFKSLLNFIANTPEGEEFLRNFSPKGRTAQEVKEKISLKANGSK